MQRCQRSVLNDRVLWQGRAGSLQLTSEHIPMKAPLLVHLSPHFISQQWRTPGNMLLLSTPKLQQWVGSAGRKMWVSGRSAAACVASIVETQRVLIGQGQNRMGLRKVGFVQLA